MPLLLLLWDFPPTKREISQGSLIKRGINSGAQKHGVQGGNSKKNVPEGENTTIETNLTIRGHGKEAVNHVSFEDVAVDVSSEQNGSPRKYTLQTHSAGYYF